MIDLIQELLEEAFRQDSVLLYLLMFGGGLLASLTPCIYPVLPMTIGYIGNQAGTNRCRVFLLSVSLVTGLAMVYAIMGAIVAAVGGTLGTIMGNGIVLFSIAMYFMIMGLSLLGVFSFPTPRFFSKLQAKSVNRKGLFGAFIIGGVSGLIVGPCTGPILAVALGAIALTLKNVYGIDYALQIFKGSILLFLFGFGQGALILVAGTFTGFLTNLPKAGVWMATLEKGSALLIIFASCLLFVFVGQNTDFPSLTRLLSITYAPAVIAPIPETPEEPQQKIIKKRSNNLMPKKKIVTPPDSGTKVPEKRLNNSASKPKPQTTTEPQPRVLEKIIAPDFTLLSMRGDRVTLSGFKGKKGVVLAFFATWCVGCVQEIAELNEFSGTAQIENIVVLGINYKQTEDIVSRLIKSQQIVYEVLLDKDGAVTNEKLGIVGLPHIICINARGEIIYRGTALPFEQADFIKSMREGL